MGDWEREEVVVRCEIRGEMGNSGKGWVAEGCMVGRGVE